MNERRIHQVFQVSVLLKAAHGIIECVGGLLLFAVSTAAIGGFVNAITQDELVEDPGDLVANFLRDSAQSLSVGTQHFYAIYLLSHGVIKIALAAGLLRERLWAYPVSLVVLVLFIAYQVYRFALTHSPGLIVLTVLDIVVIVLVWHEYRLVRRSADPLGYAGAEPLSDAGRAMTISAGGYTFDYDRRIATDALPVDMTQRGNRALQPAEAAESRAVSPA